MRGVQDRCSRSHASPNASLRNVVKRIVSLRMCKRIGPLQLAVLCDVAPFDGLPGAEAVSA